MARGCIPIAYDIRYGPSDLIEHGVNGFLVPDGDTMKLATAIRIFEAMPPSEVASMRAAAMETAANYFPYHNMHRWRTAISDMLARPIKAVVSGNDIHAAATSIEYFGSGYLLRGKVTSKASRELTCIKVVVALRNGSEFIKIPATLTSKDGDRYSFEVYIDLTRFTGLKESILESYIQCSPGSWTKMSKITYMEDETLNISPLKIYRTKSGSLGVDCA